MADEPQDEELDEYRLVRFHAARAAGLTKLESKRFADGPVTLRTLRRLKRDGCPSVTISRIVC